MFCYCCIVYLILHLYSHIELFFFFTSRQNTTFWSKVGETGVGETGVGETGVGEQGISHTRHEWLEIGKEQGGTLNIGTETAYCYKFMAVVLTARVPWSM